MVLVQPVRGKNRNIFSEKGAGRWGGEVKGCSEIFWKFIRFGEQRLPLKSMIHMEGQNKNTNTHTYINLQSQATLDSSIGRCCVWKSGSMCLNAPQWRLLFFRTMSIWVFEYFKNTKILKYSNRCRVKIRFYVFECATVTVDVCPNYLKCLPAPIYWPLHIGFIWILNTE